MTCEYSVEYEHDINGMLSTISSKLLAVSANVDTARILYLGWLHYHGKLHEGNHAEKIMHATYPRSKIATITFACAA